MHIIMILFFFFGLVKEYFISCTFKSTKAINMGETVFESAHIFNE